MALPGPTIALPSKAAIHRCAGAFVMLVLVVLAVIGAAAPALAAEPAATREAGSSALDNFGSVALGLLAVLAVIFFTAWLVRRLQGLQGPSSNAVKVLAVLPVGQRERVALLEVGKTQLLVGITAQSIRTLHVFDEPVVDPGSGPSGDFASRLQAMLSKGMLNQGKGTKKQGDPE